MWDKITYLWPNSNDAAVEVWEWISNSISHFTWINYQCLDWSQTMLVKGSQIQVDLVMPVMPLKWYCVVFIFSAFVKLSFKKMNTPVGTRGLKRLITIYLSSVCISLQLDGILLTKLQIDTCELFLCSSISPQMHYCSTPQLNLLGKV